LKQIWRRGAEQRSSCRGHKAGTHGDPEFECQQERNHDAGGGSSLARRIRLWREEGKFILENVEIEMFLGLSEWKHATGI
jgi:hypothetical protein